MTGRLATNRVSSDIPLTRRGWFEGREHLICPVIPIVEGVLNEFLVPADEIAAFVEAWNGIPLPVGHPMERGCFVSANTPDVIEREAVGRFFGAKMDGPKLKGELWIDIAKARELGGEALATLERLEAGNALEVSTAFWSEIEEAAGEFGGKAYKGIHRNLRPDHLALLPFEKGACSWEDGAGAPRVNSRKETRPMTIKGALEVIASKLGLKVNVEDPGDDETSEVTEPVTQTKEGHHMKAKIDALIANSQSRFEETDRAWLEKLTEDQLAKLEPVAEEKQKPATNADKKPGEGAEAQTAEETKEHTKQEPVVESMDTKAAKIEDPELRSFLQSQLAAHRAYKQAIIDALSTNSRCAFTKERLQSFELSDLEAIAKSCELPEADYSGVPGPTVHRKADDMPEPPVI